jgi:hypothetical protein
LLCRLEDLWLNDNQIPSLDGIEAALAGSREKLTTIYLERNPCVSISRLRCLVIDCCYKPIGLNMSLCHPFFFEEISVIHCCAHFYKICVAMPRYCFGASLLYKWSSCHQCFMQSWTFCVYYTLCLCLRCTELSSW